MLGIGITRSGKRNELDEKLAVNDRADNFNINSAKCVAFFSVVIHDAFSLKKYRESEEGRRDQRELGKRWWL